MTKIIAEIGQNHNGSLVRAKILIQKAKEAGCDYVKFIKRYLPNELTEEAYNREYSSNNAFKKKYGEHRKFLEFNMLIYEDLVHYAKEIGIKWFSTICDPVSYEMMKEIGNPIVKVPSKDITNYELLDYLSKQCEEPIIISTGLATEDTLNKALEILGNKVKAIFYCVSEYPTQPQNLNLQRIQWLREDFYRKNEKISCDCEFGLSSHYPDIEDAIVAVGYGVEWIEKHITINKELRGTDHKCSLEPDEFSELVKRIRKVEKMRGKYQMRKTLEPYLKPAQIKLMKKKINGRYLIP